MHNFFSSCVTVKANRFSLLGSVDQDEKAKKEKCKPDLVFILISFMTLSKLFLMPSA